MKATQVLLILFFIQGDVYSKEHEPYCTEQPDSIMVDVGESSVTIPCNFSYPTFYKTAKVRVYWRHAKGGKCGMSEIIYSHTEKKTHADYKERITMEGNPQKERTATIRIKELKETDGPMFCCRIELYYEKKTIESWQNQHGTYIRFKGQYFVEQPDVVPAVIGEDISIPCALHNKSPDIIEEITWRVGTSDLCSENSEFVRWNTQNITQKVGRWRLQKSEKSFLLHINNVRHSDSGQYCCEVRTKTRSDGRESSAHGTQLVIADPTHNDPEFIVNQSSIISTNEGPSVTIGCSYTVPPDRNLLWSGVFWRVGSPTGPFAYHPSALMIHPSYTGRTKLSGLANLQINGFQDTDNTTYYCFVMLKFCIGTNKANSMLRYGTQLNINENVATSPGLSTTHSPETPASTQIVSSTALDQQHLSVILAAVGVLLFLIILCVILIILKKRGVICKKKERAKSVPSPVNHASRAPSNNVEISNIGSSNEATSQEEFGGTVYAHLNMEALQTTAGKRNKEKPSSDDNLVVYAAVKPTSDQAIYSTVQ